MSHLVEIKEIRKVKWYMDIYGPYDDADETGDKKLIKQTLWHLSPL